MIRQFATVFTATSSIALMLSACVSVPRSGDGSGMGAGGLYHDSAFDDHNRPPHSMKIISEMNGDRVDPLYMRVQADYYYSIGEAYSYDGDSLRAVDSFREVLLYDAENPAVRTRLGTELLRLGRITESIEQLELALAKDPKNVDAHLILGGVLTTLKMYEKAVEQYSAVTDYEPDNTDAQMYLGAVYAEQKKFDLANKQFEKLLKNSDFTQQYLIHYYMARVYLEQKGEKNQKLAEISFNKSLENKSDFLEAALALSELYKSKNQIDKSIRVLKNFQKENGSNAKVAELLSSYYLDQNNLDQAYEQLEILETHSEYAINAKLKIALILIQQQKYKLASRKLNEILLEVPDSDKVHFYLGAVHEELREFDIAVMHYKLVNSSSSMYGDSVVHAAYILNKTDQTDDALKLLESAIAQSSDQFGIYAMYASILDERAEYDKAHEILSKGVEKFPENAQMRFYFGTIKDRLGKKDQVVIEMKKVVELDPKHVQGLNYLAFTLAEKDEDLEEAETYARRAFTLDPKDGYVMDTLGWVLYKRNHFQEAVRYLEGALKLQPNVSVIAEHLGDVYAKLALLEKAMKMYHRAVELESDKKKVDGLRSKLTAIENQSLRPQRTPALYRPSR